MKINSIRFGCVDIEPDDLIHFPAGIFGMEHCREWILLADAENDALGWLQSSTRPDIALAVVCPRRFVPEYQVRISRGELTPLEMSNVQQARVLAILGKNDFGITLNLKAPLVINLERRLGRQVITNGDQPIQYQLVAQSSMLRKTA